MDTTKPILDIRFWMSNLGLIFLKSNIAFRILTDMLYEQVMLYHAVFQGDEGQEFMELLDIISEEGLGSPSMPAECQP